MKNLYVLFIWGDVEPKLFGPFESQDERDNKAKELREKEGDEHGIFMLEVSKDGKPEVDCYSGAFFDE